jgi:hypothetical protein
MRKIACRAWFAATALGVLTACAPAPAPVLVIPPGATPQEVTDYATAQVQYRAAKASGNGDIVRHAEMTFASIAQEILSRADPRLVDAWIVCEGYGLAGPQGPPDPGATFEPQFARDCRSIDQRYQAATNAIRRDLAAKIAAADLAVVTQATARVPP